MTVEGTKVYIYTLIFFLSISAQGNASDPEPYCGFGVCNDDEYCCRNDECCSNFSSLYLTIAITSSLMTCILLFACIYNKCALLRHMRRYFSEQKSNLNQKYADSQNKSSYISVL